MTDGLDELRRSLESAVRCRSPEFLPPQELPDKPGVDQLDHADPGDAKQAGPPDKEP